MKKAEREIVRMKFGGKCAYCGCELTKSFHVDHIEPIVRNWWNGTCNKPQNENEANYNPSCASCNTMKSSHSLDEFRRIIGQFTNSLNLYSTQYKFAKRYGLVQETEKEVVFYFETLLNKDNG